jgi:hypothetical protein
MGEVQGQVLVADLNADGALEVFAGGCPCSWQWYSPVSAQIGPALTAVRGRGRGAVGTAARVLSVCLCEAVSGVG